MSSSFTGRTSLLKSEARSDPEQISSSRWSKRRCFLLPLNGMTKFAKSLCHWRWSHYSSVSGECCWYCSGWPRSLETTWVSVPIFLWYLVECSSGAVGVAPEISLPDKMSGQLPLYCASQFLPRKFRPQSSASVGDWSYPLIYFSLRMAYLCECMRQGSLSQPPEQTYCNVNEEEQVFKKLSSKKYILFQ